MVKRNHKPVTKSRKSDFPLSTLFFSALYNSKCTRIILCATFSNNLLAVLKNLLNIVFQQTISVLQSNKCMDGHSALTKSAIVSRAL